MGEKAAGWRGRRIQKLPLLPLIMIREGCRTVWNIVGRLLVCSAGGI